MREKAQRNLWLSITLGLLIGTTLGMLVIRRVSGLDSSRQSKIFCNVYLTFHVVQSIVSYVN